MSSTITRILLTAAAALVASHSSAGQSVMFEAAEAFPVSISGATRQGGGDSDGDGFDDYEDNCSAVSNASQLDSDEDGYGNRCDADLNNDSVVTAVDLGLFKLAFFSTPAAGNWNPAADFNGDLIVNAIDLGILKLAFFQSPGPSGMSCAGSAPCPGPDPVLGWPLGGQEAVDWVVANYFDQDPGAGAMDYTGGARSWDGNVTTAIDLSNYRQMDADFPVLASAQGVVLALEESRFDRSIACAAGVVPNDVLIGLPNGWQIEFSGLKQNSVPVAVGDIVQTGDTVGVVGGSGCTNRTNLWVTVWDETGTAIDPVDLGMFDISPQYQPPLTLMDATLYNDGITDFGKVRNPPPQNTTVAEPGRFLGIGLSLAGGVANDTWQLILRDGGGAQVDERTGTFGNAFAHTYWAWSFLIDAAASGAHTVDVLLNGVLVQTYPIDVQPPEHGLQRLHWDIAPGDLKALYDELRLNGYQPISADAYTVGGQNYFSLVSERTGVAGFNMTADLDASSPELANYRQSQISAGRRTFFQESYLDGGNVRHLNIMVNDGTSPAVAYWVGQSEAAHATNFQNAINQGFRPKQISVLQLADSSLSISAFYTNEPVGAGSAAAGMTSADFQNYFNTQVALGRALVYLDIYQFNGTINFSAIFDQTIVTPWTSFFGLDEPGLQTQIDQWTAQGRVTRFILGYDDGTGNPNYAGHWFVP